MPETGLPLDDHLCFALYGASMAIGRLYKPVLDEAGITGEEVLLESALLEHDNLEGIAVWSPAPGHIRLTMISDDNFFPLQSTQIVEYDLTESLAEAAARP